jgi:hypothetical protein
MYVRVGVRDDRGPADAAQPTQGCRSESVHNAGTYNFPMREYDSSFLLSEINGLTFNCAILSQHFPLRSAKLLTLTEMIKFSFHSFSLV